MQYKNFKPEDYVIFRDRYKMGSFPVMVVNRTYTETAMAKKFGYKFSLVGQFAYKNGIRGFLATKKDGEKFAEILLKKFLSEPDFIDNLKKESIPLAEKLISFTQNYPREKIKNYTPKELFLLYKKYLELYRAFHLVNVPAWIFGGDKLAEYLKSLLEKKNAESILELFTLLSTPTIPSYTYFHDLNFLKLLNTIQEDGEFSKAFSNSPLNALGEKINSHPVGPLLDAHIEAFYWIPFDYTGPTLWDKNYYLEEIKKYIESGKDAKKELSHLKERHPALKIKQDKTHEELGLSPEIVRLFKDLQTLSLLQDERKEISTKTHVWLERVLWKEIGKKTALSPKALRYMTLKEIEEIMVKGKRADRKKLEKRASNMVVMSNEKNYYVITAEKEVKKLWDTVNSSAKKENIIKGIPASLGKAQGQVKILLTSQNIKKLDQGDVLVAPMTTPDFVPAMKKASAIITDEGGITSHAAIVSRELGIPCVIGTKNATRILKDGDLVEVDADNGIIKILQ